MRISWLEPAVIRAMRDVLLARHANWNAHFTPQFTAPPTPASSDPDLWLHIAEHVARAELVSGVVRDHGLTTAIAEFGSSGHAVELATVVAAAAQTGEVTLELCETLLGCAVDELVLYGSFLQLLVDAGGVVGRDRVIVAYEGFTQAAGKSPCSHSSWSERVTAVTDGLASLYVAAGRHGDADVVFNKRHTAQTGDVAVALTAGRSYLSAGAVAQAIYWLGRGESRALELGRTKMANTLAGKQASLKKRLS